MSGPGADKFLRLSFYVTPFFGDATKKLLTPVPPAEVRLLDSPSGEPINPGAAEKVIPAGTRARILKVEFPTAWAVTSRLIYTPRTQPWVYLSIENEPKSYPYILVLRPQLNTSDQFLAELDRYLASEDPARMMATWSEPVREAVRTKTALVDMPSDALQMAWGYPERIRIFEDRKEMWIYPGERRVAYLAQGRVTELKDDERK